MPQTYAPITPQTTLAELAATRAGASRVFYRHDLDFCCHGQVSLAEACSKKQIALDELVRAIEAETPLSADFRRWDEQPTAELVAHVLEHFHAAHRAELPRLLEMARKVEKVHAQKSTCPLGLAEHVERMGEELQTHMQKEEQILFPLILSGRGRMAAVPIQVMEEEHVDHGRNLARLRELTHEFTPPADACGTWRALYLGLRELDQQLMQHIHLENNVLFPGALRS
ncbi:MAG: iron-sulfur cluster repair protein YtfE [Planctomycetes bacterium]|nr:iron-sulfur cluster repair protein YtfE [Planctomycetota bacterium]